MTPIVFLDTETTSLRPDRRAWEVAMIRRDGDGEREISIYVSDVDLSGADLTSLRIGHFYERHPEYRNRSYYDTDHDDPWGAHRSLDTGERLLTEWDTARIVEAWTRGAHIVGAVPNFDTEVLGDMLRRHERCPAWHYHLIDVENLAVGYLRGIDYADPNFLDDNNPNANFDVAATELPWKSDDISRACGVEPPGDDERHTALGDAKWAMRLYDRITGGASA